MISFICGEVVDKTEGTVVIKCNDIGYEINATGCAYDKCNVGQSIQLYTYMQVKEDGISLFGFASQQEKNMFLRLISVSGVGCKVAQAILSGIDAQQLALALYNGDTKTLTKIKGLGKKIAERLVLELREKVSVDGSVAQQEKPQNNGVVLTPQMQDAVSVLMSLGLTETDAVRRITAASQLGATTTEELINTSFRIS